MTDYKYKDIVAKAKAIKKQVQNNYDFTVTPRWCYYICRAILEPNKTFKGFKIAEPSRPDGTYISRTVGKADYIDMCRRVVTYVEKYKKMPNHVAYKDYKINIRLFTFVAAYILSHYVTDKKLPSTVNINTKYFTKPTETTNAVYDYWVKKFGFKPKFLDDVCDYVLKHFTYQYYFDDQKSNKQVIDSKAGNCTDLLQMLVNMAEAMGYDWKVIHTQCRQSGTGHVYGMFKKKNSADYFVRDIACIADESRYCIWCEVPDGGNLLAENPSWFLSNLRR